MKNKGAEKRVKKGPKVDAKARVLPESKAKPASRQSGTAKGKSLQKSVTNVIGDMVGMPSKRYAYSVSHTANPSEVFYIPVNRLKMVYQTDEATNWDKVKENMDKMRDGQALEPVVVGYDHDIHDGHHRWLASQGMEYTHVPCIVGGTNEVERQRAKESYGELWKSMLPEDRKYISPQEGAQYVYDAVTEDCTPSEAWDNIKKRVDWDAGEAPEFIHRLKKLSPKRWKTFLCADALAYVKSNMDEGFDELVKAQKSEPLEGGEWRTIHGAHVYVKDGKVVAGGGDAFSMPYVRIHNPKGQKTPNFGTQYAQDIEPHGEYMSHDSMNGTHKIDLPNYEYGTVHFKNPFFIEHESTGHGGWKTKLSEHFGGKKGKALSNAIKKKGHDAIITVDSARGEINETVNLAGEKITDFQKSIIPDPTNPYMDDPNMMYRGIGQKEMDFINKHEVIQTKGKGNDGDKKNYKTCFTNLFTQAEGYARSNYDLYNEKQAYVIIVPKPPWVYEDEHGELISEDPVPAVPMIVIPVPKPE